MIFYYKPSMTGKYSPLYKAKYQGQLVTASHLTVPKAKCNEFPQLGVPNKSSRLARWAQKPVIHGISIITIHKAMFSTFHPSATEMLRKESNHFPDRCQCFLGFWFGSLIPLELTRTKNPWEVIIWCQKHVFFLFFFFRGLFRRVSEMVSI